MYACDSWTIQAAEHERIDAFELWGWRRFFRAKKIQCSGLSDMILTTLAILAKKRYESLILPQKGLSRIEDCAVWQRLAI